MCVCVCVRACVCVCVCVCVSFLGVCQQCLHKFLDNGLSFCGIRNLSSFDIRNLSFSRFLRTALYSLPANNACKLRRFPFKTADVSCFAPLTPILLIPIFETPSPIHS